MSNEISTQKDVLKKIATEHLLYTNRISSYTKPELFENALWIHAIGMVYDHILDYCLKPDDLRLLASLPKPLKAIAREYMKTYDPEALALSVGGGIFVVSNNLESANPPLFSNLRYVNVDDAAKVRLMKRMDDEFAIYKDVIVTLLDKESIIAKAEMIALRTSVYEAMKEYPYHDDEMKVLLQLEYPFGTVAKAVEETTPDDMEKWDLFEASLDQIHVKNKAQKKKKSHSRDER